MPASAPFPRVAIIGVGLIGGSFALALRKHFPDVHLVGYDRPDVASQAVERKIVDAIATNIDDAVRHADLVYIALPIGPSIESFPVIAAAASDTTLVTDACSTKVVLCGHAARLFAGVARFLGGHPMAGKEKSGLEQAAPDLFHGAPYALIGSGENLDEREKQFVALLEVLGAKVTWCDAETHDWAVGIVSHLPQLAALALARVVSDETDETGLPVSLAGQGLQDSLRLAGSPYEVWRDILLTNKDNIARSLDRLAQVIDHLRRQLTSKDLQHDFAAANELYKLLRYRS